MLSSHIWEDELYDLPGGLEIIVTWLLAGVAFLAIVVWMCGLGDTDE